MMCVVRDMWCVVHGAWLSRVLHKLLFCGFANCLMHFNAFCPVCLNALFFIVAFDRRLINIDNRQRIDSD